MIDILITEDNKELSTLMSDFLRAEGYTVTVADSGEKAVNIFEKYGATGPDDLSPAYYSEVFSELYAIEADLRN